jgi:hypothetical protein
MLGYIILYFNILLNGMDRNNSIALRGHIKCSVVLNYVVFLMVEVRSKIQIILLITFISFIADLLTHGDPPCSFYLTPICVVPMVAILVSSPRVLVK